MKNKTIPNCDIKEGYCPNRKDKTHCECWWDGEKCCSCGDGIISTEHEFEINDWVKINHHLFPGQQYIGQIIECGWDSDTGEKHYLVKGKGFPIYRSIKSEFQEWYINEDELEIYFY